MTRGQQAHGGRLRSGSCTLPLHSHSPATALWLKIFNDGGYKFFWQDAGMWHPDGGGLTTAERAKGRANKLQVAKE